MYFTTVHIERPEGTIIATGVAAQWEAADLLPVHDEEGQRDALRVTLFVLGVPGVGLQRRDVVQDERNSDPLTGQPVRLRVVGWRCLSATTSRRCASRSWGHKDGNHGGHGSFARRCTEGPFFLRK